MLDLSGLAFIDAAGLGCIAELTARPSRGGRIRTVRNATPRVARTFALGGLEHLLTGSAGHPAAT